MLRIDCKSAKYVIEKNVENIASKHIFALGTIPKPNYSFVLASQYDPYALATVHQPVKTIYPNAFNASQYVRKQYIQNLFSVEPNRASITNPFRLATSYFPPNFH